MWRAICALGLSCGLAVCPIIRQSLTSWHSWTNASSALWHAYHPLWSMVGRSVGTFGVNLSIVYDVFGSHLWRDCRWSLSHCKFVIFQIYSPIWLYISAWCCRYLSFTLQCLFDGPATCHTHVDVDKYIYGTMVIKSAYDGFTPVHMFGSVYKEDVNVRMLLPRVLK